MGGHAAAVRTAADRTKRVQQLLRKVRTLRDDEFTRRYRRRRRAAG
jgi:2-methylcitrate dehydratase PrpD